LDIRGLYFYKLSMRLVQSPHIIKSSTTPSNYGDYPYRKQLEGLKQYFERLLYYFEGLHCGVLALKQALISVDLMLIWVALMLRWLLIWVIKPYRTTSKYCFNPSE